MAGMRSAGGSILPQWRFDLIAMSIKKTGSGSKIDFGYFDPMFALNAALGRNTIPWVSRSSA
jgi:hypothetical protein